jgi:ketopantoate reductase
MVVGAGAVGQCYAGRLALGGAQVAFRVRRPAELDGRFVWFDLRRGGFDRHEFRADVVGTDAELAAWLPDVVLLTVPTDALREGTWLAPLLLAAGDALVVALEPGREDARVLRAARPDVRLAQGIVALIAYQAPLPGETRFPEPGVAVYAPLRCPFAGPPEVLPALGGFVDALERGGLKSRIVADLTQDSTFGTIVMATWVTALRAGGWTFDGLRDSGPLGYRAAQQGIAVLARETGLRPPRWPALAGPRVMRTAMRLGAWVMPLPLETYLRYHFTKIGTQTRMHLRQVVGAGPALGLPVDAVAELIAAAEARHPLGADYE